MHQIKTKKCLKIQGKNVDDGNFSCYICDRKLNIKCNLYDHISTCEKKNKNIEHIKNENKILKNKIIELEKEVEILRHDKKDIQERYDHLSITAVKRPTNSTKNIQVNNYIKNMSPLLKNDLTNSVQYLTLEHHVKGI